MDGFVIGDTLADDIDAHVGRRIVDGFARDAAEDFFEDGEGLEVAIVIDCGDAVFVQVEIIDHVFVGKVGRGGLVGDVDGVFERK